MPDKRADSNSRAIAFLRIAVGVLFLILGEYKVASSKFVYGGGFQYWINRFIADGAYPFMLPVLKNFVLRHATPIALLVAIGEVAIGLSLTIGLLTRFASVAGVIYMLSLLFSANYPGAHAPFWQYFGASLDHLVLALCFFACWLGDPEARFSVRHFRTS